MKSITWLVSCAVLAAGFAMARAEDTPAQAAARAALRQKMFELDYPQPQPAAGQPAANWADPAESTMPTTNAVAAVTVAPTAPRAKPRPARPPANLIITGTTAASPTPGAKLAGDIVTTAGFTYRDAYVEKVEEDGLIISYAPAGGGVAISKVYFNDLPARGRQQYKKN